MSLRHIPHPDESFRRAVLLEEQFVLLPKMEIKLMLATFFLLVELAAHLLAVLKGLFSLYFSLTAVVMSHQHGSVVSGLSMDLARYLYRFLMAHACNLALFKSDYAEKQCSLFKGRANSPRRFNVKAGQPD